MKIEDLMKKWKELCRKLNEKGIPVPLVRDPKKDRGSVSLTLVFISFNVWLVSIVGKAADVLGGMDTDSALQMFLATAGLYWGRKLTSGKGETSLDGLEDLQK